MYTQCPDCDIAFKVTAEVLKQAAGKVRCGGCGNAFNALSYLSEQMPKQPVAPKADTPLPELKPEIIETDDGLPRSISAEQSAALLKTLDDLAGSDIRIEDTGVEWRVLDEQEAAAPAADDDDADLDAEAVAVNVDELRFDDNTPLPDDFDLDDEPSIVPEAVPEVEDDETDTVVEERQPEIALSEPDEWTDLLGEFKGLVEEVAAPLEEEPDAVDEGDDSDEPDNERGVAESSADELLDMDTQFALQAEAMGIDLSSINAVEDELDEDLEERSEDELELGEEEAEDEPEPEEVELEDDPEPEEEEPEDESEAEEIEPEDESEAEEVEPEDESEAEEEIAQLILLDEQDEQETIIDEPIVESHTIENELAGLDDPLGTADSDTDEDDDSDEHYVPPMTEEELTVNMLIDEDLMALAIEDDDGFASTIVIPEKDTKKKAREEKTSTDDAEIEKPDKKAGFETIIMEGESIRSALDSDKRAADKAEAAKLVEQARAKEAQTPEQSDRRRYGMIAAGVVLVLLFTIQLMHQSREALATIPAFSNTIGQVYRAIGRPVQPAWDITGWRFEATKGSTEGDEEELTVYSRLGNNSDGPLPYPLIGISLTDRFEETIGSRMLDPVDYLPTDLDPRKLVEPGNTFNAVITIKSTTEDATGFKLNVCYRLSDGQLRCAIDDFK